ncbi:MAG: Uroporphyrin-III C/tetrapyrrole (Corrin/Porphyrin) methyltransferase [Dehalococcoidia bacterium]|nr:Uroporphyrin-III C/tetrapyrrole (Corrin/Porphyrin) methyltransferase [Dehalococcoidia bacterium]
MPTLYLVGTPIGNLEDMTFRAVRVLKEVPLVAAEDTRRARVLFAHYGIQTPVTSYHEQGSGAKAGPIIRLLATKDVALISEAGMPSISDPGFGLVREALAAGAKVEVVPGPSAVTAAVAASGLPSDQFLFLGFLPRTRPPRKRAIEAVRNQPYTLVVLESPHRIVRCLQDLAAGLGDRRVAVCRELTKLHEEVFRGTLSEAQARFEEPRGEFTLVIERASENPEVVTDRIVSERLQALMADGLSSRDAVTGMP